jgi:hypothetical protein
MNSRERLIAVASGTTADRKPLICWPIACPESDAAVLECADLAALSTAEPARLLAKIKLVPVLNPFGRALKDEIPLSEKLADDPDRGELMLIGLIDDTRARIQRAFDRGADGILYLLYGARAVHTTPMEYGGHYLERDRELLSEIQSAAFNIVFVVGEDDAYLDFVSDLPAHAFAWDSQSTGTSVAQMRAMRAGALATNSPDADIELCFGTETVAADLERNLMEWHTTATRDPESAIQQSSNPAIPRSSNREIHAL